MRFSSLLCLILIWIRVLKFIFQNPIEVAKKTMTSHPFFHDFLEKRTMEAYIDGLCESPRSIRIRSSLTKSTGKHILSDILSLETSSSDDKQYGQPQCRCLVSDEDDDVTSGSHTVFDEVERSPSAILKKANKKKTKSKKH